MHESVLLHEAVTALNINAVGVYVDGTFGRGGHSRAILDLLGDAGELIAFDKDLTKIEGFNFYEHGETPGLGARITDKEIQNRFVGKKIMDGGIAFIKGEAVKTSFTDHEVDGLSGATMTTKGVNKMLEAYIAHYENYFNNTRK